ncbi:MAG: RIP metalloprotease RseP [Pleomorphochaeta sp.]
MDQILSTIIKYAVGILGVGIIVLLHEIGHFIAARIFKIDVEIFSVGFGPKMIGKRIGHTEYRISWFLFGGYCKMKGADDLTRALDHNKDKFIHIESGSLFSVKPIYKFLTYLAGPTTNFLLTILLCTALFTTPHQELSIPATITPIDEYPILFENQISPASIYGLEKYDKIIKFNNIEIEDWQNFRNELAKNNSSEISLLVERNDKLYNLIIVGEKTEADSYRYGITYIIDTQISLVRLFSPEYKAGLRKGDIITKVNGNEISNNLDLLTFFKDIETDSISLTINRDKKIKTIIYTPETNTNGSVKNNFSLSAPTKKIEGQSISLALTEGFDMAINLFNDTIISIKNLITRNTNDIRTVFTGPMRASLMIGNITVLGFENNIASGIRAFLYLLAVVSISLTIANLLPIPAFDGGQMLISLLEMIRKKKISPKHYWISQIIGLIFVIILFSVMYFVDIRYFLSLI